VERWDPWCGLCGDDVPQLSAIGEVLERKPRHRTLGRENVLRRLEASYNLHSPESWKA
jgi:hypothetical protein